jgi:hypothetical protein
MTAPTTAPASSGDSSSGTGDTSDPLAQFQSDLDRLADLSDDDLRTLEQNITDAFDQADQGGDDTAAGQLADALDSVRNEIAQRSEAPSAAPVAASGSQPDGPAETTELPPAESPAPGQSSPDGPVEGTDPQTSPEGDQPAEAAPTPTSQENAVTASTVQVTEPEVPEGREPVVASASFTSAVVAGASLQGMEAGQTFTDRRQLAQKMARRIEQLQGLGGDGEKVLVASVRNDIPEDRMLKFGDPIGNREKIDAATDADAMRAFAASLPTEQQAMTAAGGCCAPLDTRYDLFGIGDTDRPVKASMAGFGADRGGIRFFEGPTLDAIGAAVGFWTCADDAAVDAADPDTWKVCARVDCPDEATALVQAVTLCLTFGVMQSRVFPEMVTANNNLALVSQARLSESALLSQIKAQSKAVNGGTVIAGLSFLRTLLVTVDRAAAYYRDRHRLAPTTPLRARFPVWMLSAIDADMVLQPPSTAQMADNFGMSQDEVLSFFRDRNINVTWTLDTPNPGVNGGGEYADLAAAGTVPGFPANMEWSLSIEGSFLFLDGGQLDLGIVRDSTLVRTNDYQTFSETFESAVRVGGEALWVTTPVTVTGRYAGPINAGTAA